MWVVKKILRSFADTFASSAWSRLVEAVQGEWQGETRDGVSVSKCGRMAHWFAYGNDGDRMEIPPSATDYAAILVVGCDKNGNTGDAKGLAIQAGQTSVTVRTDGKSFFIQGTFMLPLDEGGLK